MASPLCSEELVLRAQRLKWLLFDIDGVFTDGRLLYSGRGEEMKQFDVKDGLGLKLAQSSGLKVGVLSGRRSHALKRRIEELALDELLMNRTDKKSSFEDFLVRHELTADQVAYAGDDLLDLPVLTSCGLSFAPADAVVEVRQRVHKVLVHPGGHGAVREMVEEILRARGDWERTVGRFLA